MAIKALELANGTTIFVEAEQSSDQNLTDLIPNTQNYTPTDLPDGAEATGLLDDLIMGSKLLQETITGAAQSAYDGLKGLKPDECTVEINIGFKSDDKTLIAYLAKGQGSLKITAKWKQATPKEPSS